MNTQHDNTRKHKLALLGPIDEDDITQATPQSEVIFPIYTADRTQLVAEVVAADAPTATAIAARIVACVNACNGINPEAVRDLLAALEWCADYLAEFYEEGRGHHIIQKADAALSKATT